jgi:putative modified peptide
MIKKATGGGHPPLDPKVADKLLDLLGQDNEFRRLFKKDPVAALAKVGHQPAKELAGSASAASYFSCMQVDCIAPKKEIMAAREELRAHLTAQGNHINPHAFEAGKVMATLRRK